jgi:hypothetical protein
MNNSSEVPNPNIVGWTWCILTWALSILAGMVPILEYNHEYYHGPSVSYETDHQGMLFFILFSSCVLHAFSILDDWQIFKSQA